MFATLALRSIKCGEVATYLPIYAAGYVGILSNSSEDYLGILSKFLGRIF
jgi:hypothetical protein